ncbi:MAG: carboxypeptidase regulatory-like domain-containing protein, partial [Bacteroidales bacterium]|nr:carboxypeptidase regulatory-like domain-containing protein [Bacteroidales bacterium]
MKQIFRQFALTATCLFIASAVMAQVTTSSMSGKVSEANGIPAVGATVVATHTPTGTNYLAVADRAGSYRIDNMRAGGPYTVTISLIGFRKVELSGISLALADNLILNHELEEEAFVLGAVVVTAESVASNMRSDRAGAITNVSQRDIARMPTVSRSINDLIRLTPQAYSSPNGPAIGGGHYRQNFITVDGAAFNNGFGIGGNLPGGGSPISIDALDQISISLTPYDVRQSGFVGAAVNAVTKSGTNEFKGSLYTYFTDDRLRGNKVGEDYFTNNPSETKIYGVTLGGPIIKDKLFFFVNYETEKS